MILGLWDFLLSILILFPLLTGGVWIRRPHFFVELSDLAVPVVVMVLLAFVFKRLLKAPIEESPLTKLTYRVWRKWCELLQARPKATLWSAFMVAGSLLAIASLRRHASFGSHSFDLSIYYNAIWNLAHGNGYLSAPKEGINLFLDHQQPTFWLLAPLIKLFPGPETLLILQGYLLALPGVILYFLTLQYLPAKHWGSSLLPLLYWIYNPLRNVNAFDFHPEIMMLPLALFGIYGVQTRSVRVRVLGILALILASFTKESGGPVCVGIGLAWLLGASPRRSRTVSQLAGLFLLVEGTACFYFDTKILPGLLGGKYAYTDLYSDFGIGITDLALAPILKPVLFWGHVLNRARLKYLFFTLGPLGFLPLLNWRTLPAWIPGFLMLFLSQGDHRVDLLYHYAIEPSIGLFWALPRSIVALEYLFKQRSGERFAWLTPVSFILFWALALMSRSELFRIRYFSPTPHQRWLTEKFLPCMDPQASLVATDALVPHLSSRLWAHNPTRIETSLNQPVECVVLDSTINNWPMNSDEMDRFQQSLSDHGFKAIYTCQNAQVFQADSTRSHLNCLRCQPECQ